MIQPVRDSVDLRDWQFSERAPSVHAVGDVDMRRWCSPVSDQLGLDSCVANACADSLELCNGLRGLPAVPVSRLQIYFNARVVMNPNKMIDDGVSIRAAFKAMALYGVCPESEWPYDPSLVNSRPCQKAARIALRNRLRAYLRIMGEDPLDQVLKALRCWMPVVFALPITSQIMNPSAIVVPPTPGEATYGAHSMVAVGSVQDGIVVRNSWGKRWGDGGYAILDRRWFSDNWTYDMWVPSGWTEMKDFS